VCHFSFKDLSGVEKMSRAFSGLFSSKKEEASDKIAIQIFQQNSETKQKELICEGNGSWVESIYFEDKLYWSYTDKYEEWKQNEGKTIPSDTMRRIDLNYIKAENWDRAQEEKERLENIQRNDKKLREKLNQK
jgi:hypothetical protein